MTVSLTDVVRAHPFDEYQAWWPLGDEFMHFMSQAMVREWQELHGNNADIAPIEAYVIHYLGLVYDREMRPELVREFQKGTFSTPVQSGEFDAVSYAFFRHAFELIEQHEDVYEEDVAAARRRFTKHVGMLFFRRLHMHMHLEIPTFIKTQAEFSQLQDVITRVGDFLTEQGYLRDHFDFRFDVDTTYQGATISQDQEQALQRLVDGKQAFALYEMGYPAILPSAVYLYNTMGEAQHHSSRTIEQLFEMAGYCAAETDDFDPTDFPSERVVELWTIQVLNGTPAEED